MCQTYHNEKRDDEEGNLDAGSDGDTDRQVELVLRCDSNSCNVLGGISDYETNRQEGKGPVSVEEETRPAIGSCGRLLTDWKQNQSDPLGGDVACCRQAVDAVYEPLGGNAWRPS